METLLRQALSLLLDDQPFLDAAFRNAMRAKCALRRIPENQETADLIRLIDRGATSTAISRIRYLLAKG